MQFVAERPFVPFFMLAVQEGPGLPFPASFPPFSLIPFLDFSHLSHISPAPTTDNCHKGLFLGSSNSHSEAAPEPRLSLQSRESIHIYSISISTSQWEEGK